LFYTHPFHTEDRDVWKYILDDPKIKIIHLVRKNKLRTYISGEIAKKTDKWTLKSKDKINLKEKQIEIDFNDFHTRISKIYAFENETRENFKNHSFVEVSYEDLVYERENTMSKIFNFLGVKTSNFKTSYKKQNSEALSDLITNFDDFQALLKKSEYSNFLEMEKIQ